MITGRNYETGHKRNELDIVIDVRAQAREHVNRIMLPARLNMLMIDGKIELVRDEVKASSRTFSEDEGDGNRKGIRLESNQSNQFSSLIDSVIPDSERINSVRVIYTDRAHDYAKRTIELRDRKMVLTGGSGTYEVGERVSVGGSSEGWVSKVLSDGIMISEPDPTQGWPINGIVLGDDSGAFSLLTATPTHVSPERVLEMNLFGVTRVQEALRHARYLLNRAQFAPARAGLGFFFGDQDLILNDRVSVHSSRIGWAPKELTILDMAYEQDGTGTLNAFEYHADVFVDNFDPIPPLLAVETTTPQETLSATLKPSGSDSKDAEDEDATTGLPPPKQVTKRPSSPPPTTKTSQVRRKTKTKSRTYTATYDPGDW